MAITLINNSQKAFTVVDKAISMDRKLELKDRGMLLTLMSLPPTWRFSVKGLETMLPDGRDAINAALNRLEEKNYLIRRKIRDDKGHFSDTCLYINPHPEIKMPFQESPYTENPYTANPQTDNPQLINNKEIKTKEISNKESIIHSAGAFADMRDAVKSQIDYDAVAIDRKNDISLLDTMVDLLARTLICEEPEIKIGKVNIPAEDVKARFRKLNLYNIEFVIDRFNENTTKIKNPNAYLLRCLYEAEGQEEIYWNNLIKSEEKEVHK